MNKKTDKIFGYELLLNVYDCDLDVLQSKEKLTEYVTELCKLIDMKKYGETLLEYFGTAKAHTKGYSLMQFIETSAIIGHFSEFWKIAYINIFSCQPYDHKKAKVFTKKFFNAKSITAKLIVR
jgi:S-adenosylmethionine/arginine decarboxylase-like enzyme